MKRLGALLAVSVLMTACGGDDPTGPRQVDAQEYAQVVVAADTLFWRDLDETTAQFARAGPDTVSASTAFGSFALLSVRYQQTLAAVVPPEGLVVAHDAFVAELERLTLALTDAGLEREQVSFLDVFVEEPDLRTSLDEANAALRDACSSLQSALGSEGFSVGLRCGSFQ